MTAFTWVETLSDLMIALSYFSIPISLASLAAAQDLRISYLTSEPRLASSIKTLIVLIIAFIGLCGVTHLLSGVKGWVSDRMVTDVFKVLTAVVSLVTAIFLHCALPILLSSIREVEVTDRGLPAYLQRINHMVFESSGHLMSMHDPYDLSFESVNDAIKSLGLRKEDVLTRNLYELVEDEDVAIIKQAVAKLEKVPNTTQDFKYHIWDSSARRRRTMEASMFFSRAHRSNDSKQSHVFIISKDVTDRDEREALQLERLRFTEANKTRMRYISSVAHNLKTPLITFQLSLALLEAGHASAEQKAIVHEAKVSVEMMSVVMNQALDSGQTEDGNQLQPKRGRVNISEMITKCKKIMSNYAKCVPLSFHFNPDVEAVVITDGGWVWQMCINLMTNACKYTVKGYIRLDVSIVLGKYLPRTDEAPRGARSGRGATGDAIDSGGSVGLFGGDAPPGEVPTEQEEEDEPTEEADHAASPSAFRRIDSHARSPTNVSWDDAEFLCFSVSDTGIGVADNKKGLLFKAFSQVQARQSNGTGLGLYSVKQKAVRLGGTCGMRDNVDCVDGGSVFFFAVPYVPDIPDDAPFPASAEAGKREVGVEAALREIGCGLDDGAAPRTTSAGRGRGPKPRRDTQVATRPSLSWEGTAPSAGYSHDIEAPAGRLGVEASSGVVLDHASRRKQISVSGGIVPAPPMRGGALAGGRGKVETNRRSTGGGGWGTPVVHVGQGGLRRGSKENGLSTGASVGQGDVLVVDDSSTARSLLKRAVIRMGRGVDTACTGEEALQMVERRPYQLVLCDLQMPVMDGPEFTQRWRVREAKGQLSPSRRGFRQKIIGMSANGEAPEIQTCKDSGMDGFCAKPIKYAALKGLIDDHCRPNVKRTESPVGIASNGSDCGVGSGGGGCLGTGKPASSASTAHTSTRNTAVLPHRAQAPEKEALLGDNWAGKEEEDG